ncbi:hypothetical protein GCM10009836_37480 [Pseudonocardia ailaonensis]|uniref:Nucleotidyl transferase AbiEii/AbiGii toxin family protein n=1 Tax=Pseudonocardia ailaonensis TaxID=367279 RepID=A0ABN2N656_9PSEU
MSGDHPTGYATPDAMWSAVVVRSKKAAKRAGSTAPNLTRQFVYDRFLARLFTHAGGGEWVLKGGTALLARVRTARHSRDIDLLRERGTLDSALDELERAAAVDLRDHLRFVPGASSRAEERPGQPGTELAKVKIDAYAGVRLVSEFVVDIVLNAVITGDPESRQPEPTIELAGIESPAYLIYPVADHVADKLCATFELYGHARLPSSRVRDLVDLVVIARTQHVDAGALRVAIDAERVHRALPEIGQWGCPDGWVTSYAKVARDVVECSDHRSFSSASALASAFLNPILSNEINDDATWSPSNLRWEG